MWQFSWLMFFTLFCKKKNDITILEANLL